MELKVGTVLLAKEWNPERTRGGSGVAVVLREADGTNFILIEWIKSVCNPYAPEDVASVAHLDDWFDIIDDSLRDQYVPKECKSQNNILKYYQ